MTVDDVRKGLFELIERNRGHGPCHQVWLKTGRGSYRFMGEFTKEGAEFVAQRMAEDLHYFFFTNTSNDPELEESPWQKPTKQNLPM